MRPGAEHPLLIAARAVQGTGAAMMLPATLSIISATFPAEQRGAAVGTWAGIAATALAIGPLVGGLVTEHVNWNWIFFLNVPIGALGLVVGRVLVPESRDPSSEQSLDVAGLATAGSAMFALVFALIEADNFGWSSPTILGLLGASLVGLLLFLRVESRKRLPMLDLSLFRNRTFVGANAVAVLVTLAMFGVLFFLSLYMQQVLGYSPVRAGLTFLPMTGLIVLVAPIAGRLADRLGSRWLMASGLSLVAVALLLLSRLGEGATFWSILPGLAAGGVGMALTQSPMTAAALGSSPVAKAGVASGLLNTSRQVGGALGIAIMGAILASRSKSALAAGASRPEAFVEGLSRALVAAAVIALAGAVAAAATIRRPAVPPAGEHAGRAPEGAREPSSRTIPAR